MPGSPRSGCGRARSGPPGWAGTRRSGPSHSSRSSVDLRGLAVVDEGVGLEEGQGLDDALLDAAGRGPAKATQPGRVEENPGRVPNPAALSPGVDDARPQAEGGGDDGDALVDRDPVPMPEVEAVDRLACPLDGHQHAVHAVADVEVTLLLP